MSIVFPDKPILVIVEGLGDCVIIYIKDSGMHQNDEACVAKLDGGQWYHVTTDRIKSWNNATYGIKKQNP